STCRNRYWHNPVRPNPSDRCGAGAGRDSLWQRAPYRWGPGIELRPDRDHHVAVERVDGVDHALRIGEALGVETLAAPLILRPVEPVLHDVVDRQLALAVFGEHPRELV